MATYQVTAHATQNEGLIRVGISGIEQENLPVDEMAVVDAVRAFLETVPGVVSIEALRYEQVITTV